jgi:hypothetical protein
MHVSFDQLENRTLFASALAIASVSYNGGTQLRITGTAGADFISVRKTADGYTIANSDWSQNVSGSFNSILVKAGAGNDKITISSAIKVAAQLHGEAGHDTINGGAGADSIYGGEGNDKLYGNAGEDTIISLGGGLKDSLTGGTGTDSFWLDSTDTEKVTDANPYEKSVGASHAVGNFKGFTVNGKKTSPSKDLVGNRIADPTIDGAYQYKRFADRPLFSASGPSANDVKQGQAGDCYFLSTLAALAKSNPQIIRQSIADLGDGTYAVQFFSANGAKNFLRVDDDLATFANTTSTAYADLGAQNSMWVAIMEKAFAYFRTGESTYASLDAGWMSEAFRALGSKSQTLWKYAGLNSAVTLAKELENLIASGKSITLAVAGVSDGQALIGNHAYTVDGVIRNEDGSTSVRLRNPWGYDGAGDDGANDGYVVISSTSLFSAFSTVMAG